VTHQGRRGVVTIDPDSDNEVKLKFEDGQESSYIKVAALTVTAPLAVGDNVMWTGEDSDIPRGAVGKVERFCDDGKASAMFPSGCYGIRLHELVHTSASMVGYEVGALLIQYLSHSAITAEELVKRILDTS
jgi:hypothetical protein